MKFRGFVFLILPFAIMISGISVNAADFRVENAMISSTDWGNQKIEADVFNQSEDYKFVVAESKVEFEEGSNRSPRFTKKSFIFEPASSRHIEIPIEIPGNFGDGIINLNLYDVVDTLDQPLESQNFFSKEFDISITVPPELKVMSGKGLQIPPLEDFNETIDNSFSRILILLLHQGKSVDEIAKICGVESYYVKLYISQLQREKFIGADSKNYQPTFYVLDSESIGRVLPKIDEAISGLYDVIKNNLPTYDSVVNAMAQKGEITSDRDNLLEPSSVLYHRYPVVMGLLLWDILGRDFVNDGKQFSIFETPNMWRPNMGDYMYLAETDAENNGRSFYYYINEANGERFFCGLVPEGFKFDKDPNARRYLSLNMIFNQNYPPLYFSYNEIINQIPLSLLMDGATEFMVKLKKDLDSIFPPADNNKKELKGARLWCWNLVVTRLMEQFERNDILEKEGTGIYIMQKVGL